MRLSDYKDEKAIEVVANLLPYVTNIALNEKNNEARGNGKVADFVAAVLKNNTTDIMGVLAVLNDTDPKDYHCNAATVLVDAFQVFSDPAMLELFGLQRQTATSSTSASMTGEVAEG